MVIEVSGADTTEKKREGNAELQKRFIGHATEVMQGTQERQRENSNSRKPSTSPCKNKEEKNISSFKCASPEQYQILTFSVV